MNQEIRDDNEVKAYFDRWNVYYTIIEHDYMAHRGIHDSLRKSLQSTNRESFSILDLGCGDGLRIAETLKGLPLSLYIGVDLSAVALKEAQKNLANLPIQLKLVQTEFGEYLTDMETPKVDIILAGFALHHYTNDQKLQFFVNCANKLLDSGCLYLYDVFCRPGETRAEYLGSYCDILNKTWVALSPDERKSTIEHIHSCDYPVQYKTLSKYAEETGFVYSSKPLYADEKGFHCLYQFTKKH